MMRREEIQSVSMGKRGDGYVFLRGHIWHMRYYVDGVRYESSTKCANERAARDKLRDAIVETRQGLRGYGMDRIRVNELLDDLLADYELNNPRSSADFAAPFVKKHLRPFFGRFYARQVTTAMLQEYQRKKRGQGLSDGTINRTMALLRRAYHLGAEATPRKVALLPKFPMLREANARTGFLEHEQYRVLLSALPEELRPLLVVAYHVGCRRGELLPLKWHQVDFAAGQIRLEPGTTKNDEGRVLPIYGDMLTVLSLHHQQTMQEFSRCQFVFHRFGKRIRDFRQAWVDACSRAGLPELRFHDLRRSAVRNMVRAGVPEVVAMAISGHKTRSVFDRYNIVSERDLREAGKKMERFLGWSESRTGTKTGAIDNPDPNSREGGSVRKPLN